MVRLVQRNWVRRSSRPDCLALEVYLENFSYFLTHSDACCREPDSCATTASGQDDSQFFGAEQRPSRSLANLERYKHAELAKLRSNIEPCQSVAQGEPNFGNYALGSFCQRGSHRSEPRHLQRDHHGFRWTYALSSCPSDLCGQHHRDYSELAAICVSTR